MTSWLFTPAHLSRLTARAHERGADVVLLDLEDSVQVADKPAARAGLAEVVNCLAAHGARVAVRVNAGLSDLARDVEAAALSGVEALMLPKVVDPGVLRLVAARMAPHQDLIALIETAEGLMNAAEIARTPRVKAIAFGTEDFSADLEILPTVETLAMPRPKALILAARAARIEALGLPASIADIADAEGFERHVRLGQRLGFRRGAVRPPVCRSGSSTGSITPSETELASPRAVWSPPMTRWQSGGDPSRRKNDRPAGGGACAQAPAPKSGP
jgi:citrate lyase subunit beta/citryl-CoA lyase